MTATLERRFLPTSELRAAGSATSSQGRLVGYAALFNTLADLGPFQERIAPGAFRQSLQSRDVAALWNHNSDFPLGRQSAGTLRLFEDSRGLRFELDLPETTWGQDAEIAVRRGDVKGMSFGFTVPANGEDWSMVHGRRTRTLTRVNLDEISPVTFPAFEGTSVSARNDESDDLRWRQDYLDRQQRLLELQMTDNELVDFRLAIMRRKVLGRRRELGR